MPISMQCIFKEITRWLGLKVFGLGVVVHDNGMQVAWMDVEVPPSEIGGVKGREKFYSEECVLRVEAVEDVCKEVVEWLTRRCCVRVVDLHYDEMKELQGRFQAMDTLVTIHSENAAASKEKLESMTERYNALFMEAQALLKKYADVIPVGRGPGTRVEQFVCEVAALVGKGSAMSAAADDMVSCISMHF